MTSEARPRDEKTEAIWQLLSELEDPEIPALTLMDLGIIREINLEPDGRVEVVLTTTYTACPATHFIELLVAEKLEDAGYEFRLTTKLTPTWTTDWISEEGRRKLREYGIAPPITATTSKKVLMGAKLEIECPQCRSSRTTRISEFGSTPCKSLYKCDDCAEPFEYFKCI